jgi:hypothetical protein
MRQTYEKETLYHAQSEIDIIRTRGGFINLFSSVFPAEENR